MKAAAVLAVFAAVAVIGYLNEPDPVTSVPAVEQELDSDGLPPRIEFDGELAHACDEQGRAYNVDPDTEQARVAAHRRCERMRVAINNAPWPTGLTGVDR